MFLTEEIKDLIQQLKERMSEKRFRHTLGVADFSVQMGQDLGLKNLDELYIAALLHDIAKELPVEEQISILRRGSSVYTFREEDLLSETLYHGFCAPYIIENEFGQFQSPSVLNAVCYHTVGRENMDMFEKIIFLADYMEMGRIYRDCINVRNHYLENIKKTQDKERLINECMLMTLDNTLSYLIRKRHHISARTLFTRNAILAELSLE